MTKRRTFKPAFKVEILALLKKGRPTGQKSHFSYNGSVHGYLPASE